MSQDIILVHYIIAGICLIGAFCFIIRAIVFAVMVYQDKKDLVFVPVPLLPIKTFERHELKVSTWPKHCKKGKK